MNRTVPSKEAKVVIQSLISAITEYRLYSFNVEKTLTTICSNHAVTILNETYFTYPEDEIDLNLHLIFGRNFKDGSLFELATSDELVRWCEEGGSDRFLFVAKSIFPFDEHKTKEEDQEVINLVFGQLASDILENAPNKKEIIESFYQRCSPRPWSGSRVTIMQKRRVALEVLNDHSNKDISTVSNELVNKYIEREKLEKEEEMLRHSDQEQRFE
jgi:hypothetical protein